MKFLKKPEAADHSGYGATNKRHFTNPRVYFQPCSNFTSGHRTAMLLSLDRTFSVSSPRLCRITFVTIASNHWFVSSTFILSARLTASAMFGFTSMSFSIAIVLTICIWYVDVPVPGWMGASTAFHRDALVLEQALGPLRVWTTAKMLMITRSIRAAQME